MDTYTAYALVTYNTAHLNKSDKVRFYYALKGRDGKGGILATYGIEQLTKTVLLVPPAQSEHVRSFLSYWGCEHEIQEVLIR